MLKRVWGIRCSSFGIESENSIRHIDDATVRHRMERSLYDSHKTSEMEDVKWRTDATPFSGRNNHCFYSAINVLQYTGRLLFPGII